MTRALGHYWCRKGDRWQIVEWAEQDHEDYPPLWLIGEEGMFDNYFDEIDERPIQRPKIGSHLTIGGVECMVVPVKASEDMLCAGVGSMKTRVDNLWVSDLELGWTAMLEACQENGNG